MTTPKALDVALQYFYGWTTGNFEKALALLSDSVMIEVPINHYDEKTSFIAAVKYTRGLADSVQIVTHLGDEQQAILIYDLTIPAFGRLRVAELFHVDDGKIFRLCQIHDTAPFTKNL